MDGCRIAEAWVPTLPRFWSTAGERSADAYGKVIDQFDVQHNARYVPRDGMTYCNIFVWDVTSAMKAEIPHWVNDSGDHAHVGRGKELNANATIEWLEKHGRDHGWVRCSALEAELRAMRGFPTISTWKNPDSKLPGHMTVVEPRSGYRHAQAGARCIRNAPLLLVYPRVAGLVQNWTHE